jgi:hypothetical protein
MVYSSISPKTQEDCFVSWRFVDSNKKECIMQHKVMNDAVGIIND